MDMDMDTDKDADTDMGTDTDSGTHGHGQGQGHRLDRYLSRIMNCYRLKTLIVQKMIALTCEC